MGYSFTKLNILLLLNSKLIILRSKSCKIMGIKKELGKKIKSMRIAKGYTQEKLAEMADISQKALSSIETGENFITADTLDKLIFALETTAEELFATDKFKHPNELIQAINKNISFISDDSEQLEIIYNLTKSLVRNKFGSFK